MLIKELMEEEKEFDSATNESRLSKPEMALQTGTSFV